jgi:hypothetical protein
MKPIEGGKTKVSHMNKAAAAGALPSMAAPKVMDGGRDLSGDATNCIGKPHVSRAESPTSRPHSYNQYTGGR